MRLAFSLSKHSREESWSLRAWVFAVAVISAGGAILTGALAGFLVLSEPGSAQEIFNTTVATCKPALPPEWVQGLEDTQEPIVRPLIRRAFDGMWTTAVQTVASDAPPYKHWVGQER